MADLSEAEARADRLRHVSGSSFVTVRPKRLGVAVSGGSDSMALLDLMAWHGRQHGFEVRAVTVDHGLRPEAAVEAAEVAAFCAGRGIPHDVLRWEGWDGTGNLQARARRARYALIVDWAKRAGADWVALGHTEDDQAETVVMRLARASGVDGLAGMPDRFERDGLVMVRPLLRLEREDLRDYLRDRGIGWCEDPSNEDDSFERVRARRAMGVLEGLGIDSGALARVAENARAAKTALDHYAWQEVAENGLAEEDRGDLILPERGTEGNPVPPEVLRRVWNGAILWIGGADYPPRAAAMTGMVAALGATGRYTLGGCVVSRSGTEGDFGPRLRFTREYNAVSILRCATDHLWDGRWRLEGPHAPDLEIRALGEAVADCKGWREAGMPRVSLLASPAVWRGGDLVAAPVAGLSNGWTAEATGRGKFAKFLLSR